MMDIKACIASAALLTVASLALSAPLQAQTYPNRPVTLVIPYPAGGLSDIAVRAVAQEMGKRLGEPMIVDNKPGGSGTIGAGLVLRAPPDGYTLLVNATGDVIRPHYLTVPYDVVNDFTQIGIIAEGPPMVLVVNPSSAFKSVADVVTFARANPGKLNFGSSGPGTGPSVAITTFNAAAHIQLVDVPYRGASQAGLAVIAGTLDGSFSYLNTVKALIESGQLRALAVSSATRNQALPQVPTMVEAGFKDFDIDGFVGLAAPPRTPPDIIRILNRELNAVIRQDNFRARFIGDGMRAPQKNSPEDFLAYLKQQYEKNRVLAELTKQQVSQSKQGQGVAK
jgi:tripartite-type tricarboxylate transporter receptor subunit TctC